MSRTKKSTKIAWPAIGIPTKDRRPGMWIVGETPHAHVIKLYTSSNSHPNRTRHPIHNASSKLYTSSIIVLVIHPIVDLQVLHASSNYTAPHVTCSIQSYNMNSIEITHSSTSTIASNTSAPSFTVPWSMGENTIHQWYIWINWLAKITSFSKNGRVV